MTLYAKRGVDARSYYYASFRASEDRFNLFSQIGRLLSIRWKRACNFSGKRKSFLIGSINPLAFAIIITPKTNENKRHKNLKL